MKRQLEIIPLVAFAMARVCDSVQDHFVLGNGGVKDGIQMSRLTR